MMLKLHYLLFFCSISTKFLIFLSLSILSSVYAMEDECVNTPSDEASLDLKNKLNTAFSDIILAAEKNNFFSQEDWKKIKECLEQGADLNYKVGTRGQTAIMLAIEHLQEDLFNYLIENGANINACDKHGWAPLHFMLSLREKSEKFSIQIFKKLLQHGANPNAKTNTGKIPLLWTVQRKYNDLMKFLIQYGADVNQKDGRGCSSLVWAILGKNLEAIKELCDAKALLDNITPQGYSAFHLVVGHSKKTIETIMTHACFDSYEEIPNQERDEQIKRNICGIFWALKQFGFPKDIQFNILSKLSPDYFHGANRGLCKKLSDMGYKNPCILAQVNKRAAWLEKILQSSDKQNQTALQRLHKAQENETNQIQYNQYIQAVQSLFDKSQLQKDFNDFNAKFPTILNSDPNNLVCQIYDNCINLLLDKQTITQSSHYTFTTDTSNF